MPVTTPIEQSKKSAVLKVVLAEYEWLTSVISMYLRWQHEVLYLILAFIPGAILILRNLPGQYFSAGLLILPIPVTLLSIVLAGLQSRANQASYYIHTTLKSRLENITDEEVLGWAEYLRKPPTGSRFELSVFPVIAYYIPIWVMLILLEVSPIVLFLITTPTPGAYHFGLLAVDGIMILVSVWAFYVVALPRLRRML